MFAQLAEIYGAHNLEFVVPMHPLRQCGFIVYTTSGDEAVPVKCKIDQSRYPLDEEYKVTLRSLDPRFGHDHFYVSDLESMIEQGHITMRVLIADEVPA